MTYLPACSIIMFNSAATGRDVEPFHDLGAASFIENPNGIAVLMQLLQPIYDGLQREAASRRWHELRGRVGHCTFNAASDASAEEDNAGASHG